jgi:hypothetical protein
VRLHVVGETQTVQFRWLWRECANCSNPASHRVTYLLRSARVTPESAGYRKDDISWCSDEEIYSCRRCLRTMELDAPDGMEYVASFSLARFQHMGWYKREVKP